MMAYRGSPTEELHFGPGLVHRWREPHFSRLHTVIRGRFVSTSTSISNILVSDNDGLV